MFFKHKQVPCKDTCLCLKFTRLHINVLLTTFEYKALHHPEPV